MQGAIQLRATRGAADGSPARATKAPRDEHRAGRARHVFWTTIFGNFVEKSAAFSATEIATLRAMLAFATDNLKPDLTLLLDVDVEIGLQRKRKEDEWNRLDAYELAFHQRVREGYHELCRQEPERWRVIDAMQPKEAVQIALRQAVMQFLQEKIND